MTTAPRSSAPSGSTSPRTRTEVVLPGLVAPDGLVVRSVPLAAPAAGRVVVEVGATGVSFAEQQMRRGKYYDQPAFPFVPGYDLVGTVVATGPGVADDLRGRRVAAVTGTGGWASHVEVDAADALPVPDGLDPAAVETVLVNGVTAWQMLHDVARVPASGTVLVLGANGGVGSTLVQLARHAGLRVLGTAAPRHHALLRRLGAEPLDAADPALHEQVDTLAPDGVDAVFDHVGGAGIRRSWRHVGRRGVLVSYGTAATKDASGPAQLPVLLLFARLAVWNAVPDGRRATFYNFWAGRRRAERFRARQHTAFAAVAALLASGDLVPQIAARFPLEEAARALALAESRTVAGKVVLTPTSTAR
ncbi:zinc-binding dehydrogenase [Microlunatus capsulatus]|uniref:NADPH2:quinone reductase n=1 Tax=Microlunatus capsulatus TaxID=99117 RepID=A0ABS4Z317_9ACTN|nr:zinc-binding dehydrogenase [Microlunatus capsulatus]MBP2415092.1 NADPH2:quinone reductase [Microlunatus capsulatus]